jgi:hypothetical protein
MSAATPVGNVLELEICFKHVRRTGGEADIVEGQLGDPGVELQEKRQRLANTTSGTKYSDLGRLHHTMLVAIHPKSSQLQLYCHADAPTTKAIGFREATNLAGRRAEGAARGLGESLPSSEHDDCNWEVMRWKIGGGDGEGKLRDEVLLRLPQR